MLWKVPQVGLEALKSERTRHRNRIHGILIQQGLRLKNLSTKKFIKELDLMRAGRRRRDGLLTSGSGMGGTFNYHKDQKGLSIGSHIEADS
jgi:hypothetical protein